MMASPFLGVTTFSPPGVTRLLRPLGRSDDIDGYRLLRAAHGRSCAPLGRWLDAAKVPGQSRTQHKYAPPYDASRLPRDSGSHLKDAGVADARVLRRRTFRNSVEFAAEISCTDATTLYRR